jgi:glycosyltransferase involved in cell wall biosynthesis
VSARARLLYVTPVWPSPVGNGLAMRAHAVLDALADNHAVSVLVVPLYGSFATAIDEPLWSRCEEVRSAAPAAAADAYAGRQFDIAHVFRLAAAPFARPSVAAERRLDLDDIESKTRRRVADLYRANGDPGAAERERAEALRAALLETAALRKFRRIYVSSEPDRQELQSRARAEVRVLPKSVSIPPEPPAPPTGGPHRFLFVGTLGYYPNQDAVRWFCAEIFPLIREALRGCARLDVVGAGDARVLASLASEDIRIAGPAVDLRPWYERAHCVVTPVRAGGGTRIKILEAFSYRRPVVTTGIGMEGIEAVPNQDLFVADEPAEFAAHCVRIASDPQIAVRLASSALNALRVFYSREILLRALTAGS